jgi:hypothetical protein
VNRGLEGSARIEVPGCSGAHRKCDCLTDFRQLDKAHRGFLAALADDSRPLPGLEALAFVDINSTQKRVCARRLGAQSRDGRHGAVAQGHGSVGRAG